MYLVIGKEFEGIVKKNGHESSVHNILDILDFLSENKRLIG